MMSAKDLSNAIRMKRKKLKKDGVEKMIDTAALPQMNPQDVIDLKNRAQWEETMDLPKKISAPDDPADASIEGTSQGKGYLKKKMAMLSKVLNRLSVG